MFLLIYLVLNAAALSNAGFLVQSVYGIGMLIFPTSVVLIAGLSFYAALDCNG